MLTVLLAAVLWWGATTDDFDTGAIRKRFYERASEVVQGVKDVPEAFRR